MNIKDNKVMTLSNQRYVDETIELFQKFSSGNRSAWQEDAQEDKEFRLGRQWDEKDAEVLKERQQAPLVINRVHPAVELAKAMLTANKPTFRVSAAEDSDNKTAAAMNGFIQYIWEISKGDRQLAKVIDDFYVIGMGAMLVHIDPFDDGGRGEVKFRAMDPFDIYIDPNSRDETCSDASDIIISRNYTKGQLRRLYPSYKRAIDTATGHYGGDLIPTSNVSSHGITFAGEYNTEHDGEYIRGYERYTKVWIRMYRVVEDWSKAEYNYTEDKMREYLMKPVWIMNGEIITEEILARQKAEALMQEYQMQIEQYQQMVMQAQQNPEMAMEMQEYIMNPPQPPQIQQVFMYNLLDQGMITIVPVPMQRVYMGVVIGNKKLYGRLLNCSEYPIIPFMNMHTGSPYPLSDVRLIKDTQRYINKVRSLIIAHASTSTNVKVMVPRGTDTEALKEQWAQPGAIIEVDFAEGQPIPVAPLPMPTALYENEAISKADIDHQLGLYESMAGNTQSSPDTYRGIMMLDEFGQRRIKVKQAVIEQGLQELGRLLIAFIQEFYVAEKQIRILQPNNSLTEYVVNKRLYDDYGQEVGRLNDVSVGKYDVLVLAGSTLPSNRYAQLEFYKDMYREGIIDRVEVLKKTDVFDIEGVLQRIDTIEQLQAELQQAHEQIKQLQGDIQTREREIFHTRMDSAVKQEVLKARESAMQMRKAGELYEARLGDTLKNAGAAAALEQEKIRMEETERWRRQQKTRK